MPRVTALIVWPSPLLSPFRRRSWRADWPARRRAETQNRQAGRYPLGVSAPLYSATLLQWPRLYQMNTAVVEDPHWIYPGVGACA